MRLQTDISQGCSLIWRLEWDRKVHFQDGGLTWLVSWWWLLAGGLSSLTSRLHEKILSWASSQLTWSVASPKVSGPGDSKSWCENVFYDLALKFTYCPYHNNLLVTHVSLIWCGIWIQDIRGSLGHILEAGYYTQLPFCIVPHVWNSQKRQ